jgi:soluble lytic murein transglycosylase-like protein
MLGVERGLRFGLVLLALGLCARVRADSAAYECTGSEAGVVSYTNVPPRHGSCRTLWRTNKTGQRTVPVALNTTDALVNADRVRAFDAHIKEAAQLYSLPEAIIRAVMLVESNFLPDVISEAGAMGLMQLMPETAISMGVANAFDPRQNVMGGARYLRILANHFNGDLVLTVAAYNAGPGAIERHHGVPPYSETRNYVERVVQHYHAFRQRTASASQ